MSKIPVDKQNYLECLKNQLSSRGIFSQDMQHCSFFNDIDWTTKGHSTECFSNSDKVKNYKRRFQHGPWSFFGPGEEETWYGTHTYKPEGQWNATVDVMVDNCKDSGHPAFRASSALDRGFF